VPERNTFGTPSRASKGQSVQQVCTNPCKAMTSWNNFSNIGSLIQCYRPRCTRSQANQPFEYPLRVKPKRKASAAESGKATARKVLVQCWIVNEATHAGSQHNATFRRFLSPVSRSFAPTALG
jgi:hypothetical protein